MPTNNNTLKRSCSLEQFEKNRYYHRKLMTASDMLAEQRYNIERVNTLTRQVTGSGIVCGLDASLDDHDDGLEVTVRPGLALDSCGNLVVVENEAKRYLPVPDDDDLYVYLRYAECSKDRVPVGGRENACEEECTYNRIVETYDVFYEAVDEVEEPAYKSVPLIDFPAKGEMGDPGDLSDPALFTMARSYFAERSEACVTREDPTVFIGRYSRTEGGWAADREHAPFVFTNDMLYATVARHATDFANPHQTTLLVDEPAGEDENGARVRVNDDRSDVTDVDFTSSDETVTIAATQDEKVIDLTVAGDVTARLDRLEAYVLEQPLWCGCAFATLVDTLGVEVAGTIADRLDEALEAKIYENPEAYVAFYAEEDDGLIALQAALLEELDALRDEDGVTGVERVEAAFEALSDAISEPGEEPPDRVALEAAIAQQRLCTTLDCLDRPQKREEVACFGFDEFEDDQQQVEPFEYEGLHFSSVEEDEQWIAMFDDVNDDDHLEMLFPDSGLQVANLETTYVDVTVAAFGGGPLTLSAFDGDTEVGRDSTPAELRRDVTYKLSVQTFHDTIDRIVISGGNSEGFILQICSA